ncbi:hypothetical protein VPH35_070684 [Triticum aestivum]
MRRPNPPSISSPCARSAESYPRWPGRGKDTLAPQRHLPGVPATANASVWCRGSSASDAGLSTRSTSPVSPLTGQCIDAEFCLASATIDEKRRGNSAARSCCRVVKD